MIARRLARLALRRLSRRPGGLRPDRRTWLLLGVAGATSGAVVAGEVARVWRRGDSPLPSETEHVLEAAEAAARQTAEVAVAGYRGGSSRENALLNLLGSFWISFLFVRTTTLTIRRRGEWGPFRNVRLGRRHIHHFVPGILLAFLAGGASIVTRDPDLAPALAVPFGVGIALTLDESALLLELEDVYWTDEGIVSVQITLAALALLSTVLLVMRVLRRGEATVLPPEAVAFSSPHAASA